MRQVCPLQGQAGPRRLPGELTVFLAGCEHGAGWSSCLSHFEAITFNWSGLVFCCCCCCFLGVFCVFFCLFVFNFIQRVWILPFLIFFFIKGKLSLYDDYLSICLFVKKSLQEQPRKSWNARSSVTLEMILFLSLYPAPPAESWSLSWRCPPLPPLPGGPRA